MITKPAKPAYLNLIGNKSAVPCHSHSELVISASRLAGHEVQLKNTTKNQIHIIIKAHL